MKECWKSTCVSEDKFFLDIFLWTFLIFLFSGKNWFCNHSQGALTAGVLLKWSHMKTHTFLCNIRWNFSNQKTNTLFVKLNCKVNTILIEIRGNLVQKIFISLKNPHVFFPFSPSVLSSVTAASRRLEYKIKYQKWFFFVCFFVQNRKIWRNLPVKRVWSNANKNCTNL
jgi:hypothetical protein